MSFDKRVSERALKWLPRWIDPFVRVETAPPQSLWPFLRWCLSGSMPILAVACVVAVFMGTVEVVSAILLGQVIDTAVGHEGPGLFAENAWFFIGVAGFLLILRPLGFGLSAALQAIVMLPHLNAQVLMRLHRYTMGQSVTYFNNDFAGRISQKQMQTSRAVADVALETINTLIFATATFVATVLLLISIDWRLSLIAAVWLVCYAAFIRYFIPRVRKRAAARAGARASVTGVIVDTISNMQTVKLFAHRAHEDRSAQNALSNYLSKGVEFGVMSATFRFLLITLAGILPVLLVGSVLILWQQGAVTAGAIAATGTVSLRLSQMTGWVSFTLLGIYANIGETEDGMRTLSPPHSLVDAPDAPELEVPKGRVEYRDLGFAYGRQTGGVTNINLNVAPSEKIGIVGASGAGKSTLVGLLLRLYDTEQGQILIDGTDIRTVTQDSLRRQIGMVTQDTAMFNRSARDNLAYGRPDATDEQVVEAAKAAEAHDFILGLKDFAGRTGYDAHLGERGVRLSGGQRQRVALARAILKDAPILVLDEATSALDSEVEAQIQTALTRVMGTKTVFAIAHRLSTVAQMDRIIVLDQGQIAEEGTHSDLLAKGGLYAGYWDRQSGGFLDLTQAAE